MSQWKNTDDAANSVFWAVEQYKTKANSTTQAAFYGNTTLSAFITGEKIGQFGVDANEQTSARVAGNPHAPHAGWVVRTEGSGGRSGRVTHETLVAMKTITGDGSDDTQFPDYALTITVQPSDASGNATNNDLVTFTGGGKSVPSGLTVAYKWQKWGGSSFSNLSDAGAYSGTATATLSVKANTATNGEIYRLSVANSSAAATVYTSNAIFTKTT